MFAYAVREASRFTRPLGTVFQNALVPGGWAFRQSASVLLNEEGWVVTSHHLIEELREELGVEKVPLQTGHGGLLVDGVSLEAADLHVGRVEPFDPEEGVRPARFLPEDASIHLGAPLCAVGCHQSPTLQDHYDEVNDTFDAPDRWPSGGPFPIPVTVCGVQEKPTEPQGPVVRTPDSPDPPTEPDFPVREVLVHPPSHHGHSGGPLVNWQGTVYGVLLNIRFFAAGELSGSDRDFYISGVAPSATVLGFLDQLGLDYHTEGWARKPLRVLSGG